jgi:hypothetical protein
MKARCTLFAVSALLLTANCASITRGTKDVLEVKTDPAGAQVQTSNGYNCGSTPCAIKMPRRSEFVADITKPGCKPMEVNVTHKTSGGGAAGVAGNVLVGGVIGLGVDAATGASQDLVPNPIDVELEC